MAAKRPGRPSKHDWDDKRDLCYKLYVQEGKSVRDIINHFTTSSEAGAIIPSARDFSRQFNRWQFPARRDKLPADDEARLISRLKELWQANQTQPQMLEHLSHEGWQIDPAALARLRRKHGIVLRVAKGYDRSAMGPGSGKKRKHDQEEVVVEHSPPPENASTEETARRAQRMAEIQIASDKQLSARKRRRRIRGLAHLPPDAPGLPPRYKSETSLDECKAFLNLGNDLYKDVRKQFEDICIDAGIIKKRLCNAGEWEGAKSRLIRGNTHLSAILNPVHGDISERENALEVICADVTKRMRIMKNRILVKDANNILGLDPEASKELRRQFYEILKADNFQTKLLCGPEHWNELKQQWLDTSDIARQLHANGLDAERKKCIDVLVRDAMKRHNDNNVARISHLQQNIAFGPGPGPAKRTAVKMSTPSFSQVDARPTVSAHRPNDLDPALFAALSSEIMVGRTESVPAYFRLAATSRVGSSHPKMWLATLEKPTMSTLVQAAVSKAGGSRVITISGVVKNADGREDVYQIDTDEELEAYLETVKGTPGAKVSFMVMLESI